MKTTDFDRVLSSDANGKTAATVISKGTHWEPSKRCATDKRQDTPFECVTIQDQMRVNPQVAKTMVEMIGKKIGRLTVMGLVKTEKNYKGYALWSVRCTCGYYEQRRYKTLNKPEYVERAMCSECDYLEDKKRQYAELGAKGFSSFTGGKIKDEKVAE